MFKHWITISILCLLTVTSFGQTTRHTIQHDELERAYRLFIPDNYTTDEIGHLILVLHGGGMTSTDMIIHTGERFNELVEDHQLNAIVVYPDGFGNGWNDGRIREERISYQRGLDDVDFLMAIVDVLASKYNIDPNQLFLTGFSNGAAMSYRVACEQSERVTAIAPVSNMIASTFTCEPQTPVALLSIIGDEDPILPLAGGDLFYWDMPLGSVLSLDETLAIWHDVNACDGNADAVDLPDTDPDDETTITSVQAINCEQPISNVIIHGGGHTWAGSPITLPVEEYGRTSHDIDTSEFIFEFFLGAGLG